jgi:hypothetical protein
VFRAAPLVSGERGELTKRLLGKIVEALEKFDLLLTLLKRKSKLSTISCSIPVPPF